MKNSPHPLLVLFSACAIGGAALTDLIGAGADMIPTPPPSTAPAWSLTPADLARDHATSRGVWAPGVDGAARTRASTSSPWIKSELVTANLLPPSTSEDGALTLTPDPKVARLPSLAAATASTTRGETTKPCKRAGQKLQCGAAGWAHVGPKQDMRVAGKKTTCIWAHPQDNLTTRVEFPTYTLAADQTVTLLTAIDDRAASGQNASVRVNVDTHNGAPSTHTTADKRGWQRHEISGPIARGLTLEISTANAARRHFCFKFEEGGAR